MTDSHVKSSVPKAVPSAVAFSANNTVPVLTEAQLGPHKPMTGKAVIPVVPKTDTGSEAPEQPGFTGGDSNTYVVPGGAAAPSVPRDGFLFTPGPIDSHYMDTEQARDPYAKVNNPATVGMWTRIQSFANHIAYNQVTTETGFKVSGPQQRTSVMRNALPPMGNFGVNTFVPRQGPQAVPFNRIRPSIGTDKYGTGVLNTDTYGAGQVAGGIGGNVYAPQPGPAPVTQVTPSNSAAMPTWG